MINNDFFMVFKFKVCYPILSLIEKAKNMPPAIRPARALSGLYLVAVFPQITSKFGGYERNN
jgi:hypothetical protein